MSFDNSINEKFLNAINLDTLNDSSTLEAVSAIFGNNPMYDDIDYLDVSIEYADYNYYCEGNELVKWAIGTVTVIDSGNKAYCDMTYDSTHTNPVTLKSINPLDPQLPALIEEEYAHIVEKIEQKINKHLASNITAEATHSEPNNDNVQIYSGTVSIVTGMEECIDYGWKYTDTEEPIIEYFYLDYDENDKPIITDYPCKDELVNNLRPMIEREIQDSVASYKCEEFWRSQNQAER